MQVYFIRTRSVLLNALLIVLSVMVRYNLADSR